MSARSLLIAFGLCAPLGAFSVGCVEQSPDVPSEEDVKAAKENLLSAPPAHMKFPVNADLEGKVVYLGMDVDTDVVIPGKAFTLTHYWQVKEPIAEDWRLFIHLEAPGNKAAHLNADHVPLNGKYPIHSWKKGDIIRDAHRVSVQGTWKSPTVEIYAGLWKGPLRLKVTSGPKDGENRVMCGKLPVSVSNAPPPPAKKLVARKVKAGSIKLDGKLDDAAWKDAVTTGAFVKTMDGGRADSATQARVVWDEKFLYVGFEIEDHDIWTTLSARDDKLWSQEAVEVFIDADGDGKTYIELQANPKGAIFDSYLAEYRKNQNDFDAGMKVAVSVDGTIEKRDDQDKSWTVEMQIPIEAARGKEKEMKGVPPVVGTTWKVNFFRMDMPAGKPQQGTSWSPPLVGDFHKLDKFGQLVFGDERGELGTPALAAPLKDDKVPLVAPKKDEPAKEKKAEVVKPATKRAAAK
ncbi:MAG: hypothetical protein EXR72_09435 [Myxococcales bacterium]|nr:hypothetical protein [Myxococcales bacterium]